MPDANPSPKSPKAAGDVATTATAPSEYIFDRGTTKRPSDRIPRQFGRYALQECLGKGGMGAVFKAHDTQLDRQVALKVPFLNDDDEETRQRFYREARAAATLQHAYICPVFDVGEFKGVPYLTMAFIEGRSLAQALKGGQSFPPGQTALLIRKLALAMQEAHSKGVVHRDLKPANILLRPNGEPVIMDFGLARRADDKHNHGLTREGDIIGTLDYMSPEQVEGDNTVVGPLADQYALGLILYEMLCGKRPFEGNTASLLIQIVSKQPDKPSDIRIGVPPKLEEICLKALAKKPIDRYSDMAQFAAALADFLRNPQLPLAAAPKVAPTPAAQPNQLPASATDTTETAVTAKTRPRSKDGLSSRTGMSSVSRSGLKRTKSGRRRKKNTSMLPMLIGGGIGVLVLGGIVAAAVLLWPKKDKNAAVANADPVTSQQSSKEGPRSPNRVKQIDSGEAVKNPTSQQQPPASLKKHGAGFALHLSPDAPTLAIGQPQKVTLNVERKDYQGPISLHWSAPKEVRVLPRGPVIVPEGKSDVVLTLLALTEPDGANLRIEVTAAHDSEPQRGDVTIALEARADNSGPCQRVVELPAQTNFAIQTMAFTPDLTSALIGGGAPKAESQPANEPSPPPQRRVRGGRPPQQQQNNGSVEDPNAIQICNLQRGEIISSLAGHKDRVTRVQVSGDGKWVLSVGADEMVAFWDLSQGKIRRSGQMPKVSFATMSPDAKRGLVISSSSSGPPATPGIISKFNPETLAILGTPMNTTSMFGIAPETVRTAACTTDGKEIFGGLDGKLYLIARERGKPAAPKALSGHSEPVLSSAFSPSGEYAATGGGGTLTAGTLQPGSDNKVRLWNVGSASLAWSGEGHKQSVLSLAFSPSGKLLASGSADGAIKIWKVEDGSLVASFEGHSGKVLALAFSADEHNLWSGASDRTLREWRLP